MVETNRPAYIYIYKFEWLFVQMSRCLKLGVVAAMRGSQGAVAPNPTILVIQKGPTPKTK